MKENMTLIFDFDGTLANSVDLIFSLYNDHAKVFGYEPVTHAEFPSLRKMGYKKAMKAKKIRITLFPKMILVLGREMRLRMNEVKPYDEIVETLKILSANGIKIGVLTSNQKPLVEEFFAKHNFPKFDFVVSEKSLFGKDKAIKKIIRKSNLNKNDVIYIGDEPRDVSASRKAKIKIIGVLWGLGGKEGFEANTPDYIARTPRDILEIINSIK